VHTRRAPERGVDARLDTIPTARGVNNSAIFLLKHGTGKKGMNGRVLAPLPSYLLDPPPRLPLPCHRGKSAVHCRTSTVALRATVDRARYTAGLARSRYAARCTARASSVRRGRIHWSASASHLHVRVTFRRTPLQADRERKIKARGATLVVRALAVVAAGSRQQGPTPDLSV
jgi:hypothetical protein